MDEEIKRLEEVCERLNRNLEIANILISKLLASQEKEGEYDNIFYEV